MTQLHDKQVMLLGLPNEEILPHGREHVQTLRCSCGPGMWAFVYYTNSVEPRLHMRIKKTPNLDNRRGDGPDLFTKWPCDSWLQAKCLIYYWIAKHETQPPSVP